MLIRRYTYCCGAVVAVGLVLSAASAQTAEPGQAVAELRVVPRHNQWSLVDPQVRPLLKQVVRMPAADRERLIRRGTAWERGIGIFVAEQQGDVEFLLSLSGLLDDKERTIPYALPVAHAGEYPHAEQTVAEYLSSVYLEWFGVDVDKSWKRFDQLLGPVTEPDRLVRPWIVRLRRARNDAKTTAQIKERIGKLAEDVRWAVVTLGYCNSLYPEAEASALLTGLSKTTLAGIRSRDDLLPDEPLFQMNEGTYRKLVLRECRRLLNSSSE